MRSVDQLRSAVPAVVVNVDHPSASLVQMLGTLGADAVFFDCEQGSPDIESVENMARAAKLAGVPSLVRLWSRDPWMIERMLLRGVDGIVVPRVDDAETARQVVETVRYVLPATHADKLVVVQVESREAADDIDALLEIEGIDVFFIGPVDLAKSMGFAGDYTVPEVRAAMDRVIDKVTAAGRRCGILVNEASAADYASRGVTFLYCHANDFLRLGLADFRTRLEGIAR